MSIMDQSGSLWLMKLRLVFCSFYWIAHPRIIRLILILYEVCHEMEMLITFKIRQLQQEDRIQGTTNNNQESAIQNLRNTNNNQESAIQSLQTTIKNHESAIQSLQTKNNKQESAIGTLEKVIEAQANLIKKLEKGILLKLIN